MIPLLSRGLRYLWHPRQCQRLVLLSILASVLICAGMYHNYRLPCPRRPGTPDNIGEIRPPKFTAAQTNTLTLLAEKINVDAGNFTLSARSEVLDALSEIVQAQIQTLQSPSPAECPALPSLACGNYNILYGLGCQVHQRVACLMASYALGVPLIHDEERGWPFTLGWSEIYEPMGAPGCSPGPKTYTLDWMGIGELPLIYKTDESCSDTFRHPLLDGIHVPAQLADIVERVHPNPWLWWVSQFFKYGMRFRLHMKARIDKDKASIGLPDAGAPIVGIQVRRTDKGTENRNSVHELREYFEAAEQILDSGAETAKPKSVFIASDDHLVLQQAHEEYRPPAWNVMSFPSNVTLLEQDDRGDDLYSIVRDVAVLTECDYIVCGYTSNLCRLLLELLTARLGARDARRRVRSLDEGPKSEYSYYYASKTIPNRVLKC